VGGDCIRNFAGAEMSIMGHGVPKTPGSAVSMLNLHWYIPDCGAMAAGFHMQEVKDILMG